MANEDKGNKTFIKDQKKTYLSNSKNSSKSDPRYK